VLPVGSRPAALVADLCVGGRRKTRGKGVYVSALAAVSFSCTPVKAGTG